MGDRRGGGADSAGSSLRSGQNDARVEPGAGSAGGAMRAGEGFAPRGMRDRVAADQSACFGARKAGRDGPAGAWLHRGRGSQRITGRGGFLRPHYGNGYGRSTDGGGAGGGRDGDQQRGSGAGGGGPGGSADENGRGDRGRGDFDDSGEGRPQAAWGDAYDHRRPDRGGNIFGRGRHYEGRFDGDGMHSGSLASADPEAPGLRRGGD